MRRLLILLGVLLAAATVVEPAAAAPPPVAVTGATEVIQDTLPSPASGQSDVVVQSQVATTPDRPGSAAAVTEEGLQATAAGTFGVALGLAVTQDGGRTWRSQVVPGITRAAGGVWQGVSWPTVAMASDGTIYIVAAVRSDNPCRQGLGVVRATDSGRRFGPVVLLQSPTDCSRLDGRSSLAIDNRPGHRRLYVAWTAYRYDAERNETGQLQVLSQAGPDARRWSRPVEITGPGSFTFGNTLLIGPDGALTDVYAVEPADASTLDLVASASRDGGRSFGRPVLVTHWPFPTVGAQDIRCCAPSASVDPVTGTRYATIGDPRYQHGEYDDALVFRSTDGAHWSEPVRANIGASGAAREHLTPGVAAYGGSVYVTWASTDDPHGTTVQQQVARSLDGGQTFGAAVDAGPAGDLRYSAQAPGFGYWPGDVVGIGATATGAYLAWPLPSTPPAGPQHQTLWAATVPAG